MTRSSEFVWTFHIEKVDSTKEDVKSQTVQQPNRKSRTEFIVYALESLFQERLFCGTTQVSGKHKESHRFSKTGQLLGGAPPLVDSLKKNVSYLRLVQFTSIMKTAANKSPFPHHHEKGDSTSSILEGGIDHIFLLLNFDLASWTNMKRCDGKSLTPAYEMCRVPYHSMNNQFHMDHAFLLCTQISPLLLGLDPPCTIS